MGTQTRRARLLSGLIRCSRKRTFHGRARGPISQSEAWRLREVVHMALHLGWETPPYSCLTPTFSRICPEKSQPAPGLGTAPSLSCRQAGDKGERPASPGPQHLPSVFPGNALLLPNGPSPRSSPAPASSSLSSRQGEGKQTRAPHPPAGGAGLGAPLWGCPRPANGHEAASDKRSERWPEAPTPE